MTSENPNVSKTGLPREVLEDKIKGGLVGCAMGDAIGAPLEALRADEIRARYGLVKDVLNSFEVRSDDLEHGRLKGLYTDDTQQALLIAEVLLEAGGFDRDRLAKKYVELAEVDVGGAEFGAHRGIGGSFRHAVNKLRCGVSPGNSGRSSSGSGAPMKVFPLVAWYRDLEQEGALSEAVASATHVVHTDLLAFSSALSLSLLVSRLLREEGEKSSVVDLIRGVAAETRQKEAVLPETWLNMMTNTHQKGVFSDSLMLVAEFIDSGAGREEVFEAIVKNARHHRPDANIKYPGQSFVLCSAISSVYIACTAMNFEEAVVTAINLGNDTDTVGAMAGFLAGTRFGFTEIPNRWLHELRNLDNLILMSECLLEKEGRRWFEKGSVLSQESEWTRLEVEERKSWWWRDAS